MTLLITAWIVPCVGPPLTVSALTYTNGKQVDCVASLTATVLARTLVKRSHGIAIPAGGCPPFPDFCSSRAVAVPLKVAVTRSADRTVGDR